MIDCIAFAPHPDDAELFCSGFLIKAKNNGNTTGIIDLTEGELSSNGTVESRREEAGKASYILNLDLRQNLHLSDGNIENNAENRLKIITVIRNLRPKLVLLPYWTDRHPDHEKSSNLLSDAIFYAGLKKIKTKQKAFRPSKIIYYMLHTTFEPSFILDISNEFEIKLKAINAYKSQFDFKEINTSETYINKPEFLDSIITRSKFYGSLIHVKYGEPFILKNIIKIDNINTLFS